MALGELKNGIGPDAYAIYQQVLAAVVERDHPVGSLYISENPVGSLYISENPTSPAELYGGTWERIENRFIMGASDTYPAGTTLEAGLPNIMGMVSTRALKSEYETGIFLSQGKGALKSVAVDSTEKFTNLIATEDGTSKYGGSLAIDASLSNPIYGASDTVQPPAYCMYIWRRVA